MSAMKSETQRKIEEMNAAKDEAVEMNEEVEALRERADAIEERANEMVEESPSVAVVPYYTTPTTSCLHAGFPLEWSDEYREEQRHVRPAAEQMGVPVQTHDTMLSSLLPDGAIDDARDSRLTGFIGAGLFDVNNGELIEWWNPSELEEEFGILVEDQWGRDKYVTQDVLDKMSDDDHQYTPVGGDA